MNKGAFKTYYNMVCSNKCVSRRTGGVGYVSLLKQETRGIFRAFLYV